jgi:hypothetical protein
VILHVHYYRWMVVANLKTLKLCWGCLFTVLYPFVLITC